MLNKLKSLMGYNDNSSTKNNENNKLSIESKKQVTEKNITCDVCKENIVKFKLIEYNMDSGVNSYGAEQINSIGGRACNDVVICDECFKHCETEAQKQYVWIIGKMNCIAEEVASLNESISVNDSRIEKVNKDALDKINQINKNAEHEVQEIILETNGLSSEIHKLNNELGFLKQEFNKIEETFKQ